MPVSTGEMLEALDAAIHDTPWWLPNAPALDLIGRRVVLGQYGTLVRSVDPKHTPADTPVTAPQTEDGMVFSFTRRQCKKMRAEILARARADLAGQEADQT